MTINAYLATLGPNPYQLPDWWIQLVQMLGLAAPHNNPNLDLHHSIMLFVWGVVLFIAVVIVAKASVVFMVLMERKVLAWVTQRKGPNRVGPVGLLQTLADGVKLLFKEDVMTSGQDKFLFTIAPPLFLFPVFVLFALVPFTGPVFAEGVAQAEMLFPGLQGVDIPVAALLIFSLSSISVIGMVLAGWASDNKYSLIGGLRSAAQAISYEIPLVLAVLVVVLFSGSMQLNNIVSAQQGSYGMFSWYWFWLTPVAFVIFMISAIAEVNRIPFDLPEAESELVSGYNTEYSGMKFAMFFLAEYASLFVMCALMAVFFFGGYLSPLAGVANPFGGEGAVFGTTLIGTVFDGLGGASLAQTIENTLGLSGLRVLLMQGEMISWMIMKIYGFIFFAMWLRGTLPRLKPDQLMGFSWKFLIPLALINVFVVGVQRLWNIAPPEQQLLYAGLWAVLLVCGFGGFSWFMSRFFTGKMNARFS